MSFVLIPGGGLFLWGLARGGKGDVAEDLARAAEGRKRLAVEGEVDAPGVADRNEVALPRPPLHGVPGLEQDIPDLPPVNGDAKPGDV
jgi:hypothetical protein